MILLGFFLLSISTGVLAGEEANKKPLDWKRRLEALRSVPYISYSETTVDGDQSGVVLYNPERAQKGYNFYCSMLFKETILIDMDGQVVHRWTYPSLDGSGSYHHAIMLANGDLLVIKKFEELLRLNWKSEVMWRRKMAAHHDVAQAPDGSFYAIIREFKIHRAMRVWFDAIVHLTADGEEIDRWTTYDQLTGLKRALDTRFFLDTLLDNPPDSWMKGDKWSRQVKRAIVEPRRELDYFHLNTVSVLPSTLLGESDTRFQMGNLLVCFRNVNQIAVLEKNTYRVLWSWGQDELEWPHHPTLLENGHILIFDNGVEREYSRVVELDPANEIIVWEYKSVPPEDFYSSIGGSAQRLHNGNTLISEYDEGRAFEVTEEGQVVWEWLNPVVRLQRRESVYRMIRLLPAEVDILLEDWWWWE